MRNTSAGVWGWRESPNGRMAARVIETLLALQHDPNRPKQVLKLDADEDGISGDDATDALRYLVATKTRTIEVRRLRGL